MRKERLLGLLFVGLLVMPIMLSTFAMAGPVDEFFTNVWSTWSSGDGIPENVARILLTFVIFILIYSVSDKLPGLKGADTGKFWLRVVLSFIVAFLGTAYLAQGELYAILANYSALGFVLGGILPFLIVAFFTFDIANNDDMHDFPKKMVLYLVWGGYAIFMGIRAYQGLDNGGSLFSGWTAAYSMSALAGVVILFMMGLVISSIRKGALEDAQNRSSENTRLAAQREKDQADVVRDSIRTS